MVRVIFFLSLIPFLLGWGVFVAQDQGSGAGGGPGPEVTYEDFTGYTEVDPSADITVDSATKVSWADLSVRSNSSYVYFDKTVDHFNGDFVHQFEVYISSETNAPIMGMWGVASNVAAVNGFDDGLALTTGSTDAWRLYTVEAGSPTYTESSSSAWTTGVLYYITITIDWDAGTNSTGLVTADIRTTSHTNDTGKVTLTRSRGVGEQNNYQYLYCTATYNTADGGHVITGYVQNLDIGE